MRGGLLLLFWLTMKMALSDALYLSLNSSTSSESLAEVKIAVYTMNKISPVA
jgi:hypothetical protein